jgi:cytochrome c oxidase assembly factor CtaG
MWITGAEVIGDAFFGLAVIASQNLIGAAWYHALARPWGPSLQADQIIGGGALWILGGLVGLPFLATAQSAAAQSAAAQADKPWWEDDPRFTGRFKPA